MAVTQLITAEQFMEISNDSGKRYELVEGELAEIPSLGVAHMVIANALVRWLDPFVVQHDLGKVLSTGPRYLTSHTPDSIRIPDGSFIAKSRIPEQGLQDYIPFPPDVAIEIISDDLAEYMHDKVLEYLEAGTHLVWLIWPTFGSVSVYYGDKTSHEFESGEELDGGAVLPGFRMRVGELFRISLEEYRNLFTKEDSSWQR